MFLAYAGFMPYVGWLDGKGFFQVLCQIESLCYFKEYSGLV
ncbi:hypothetical protein ES703_96223 [subsurface metagenome]